MQMSQLFRWKVKQLYNDEQGKRDMLYLIGIVVLVIHSFLLPITAYTVASNTF